MDKIASQATASSPWSKGVLCVLSTSGWSGVKKLSTAEKKMVASAAAGGDAVNDKWTKTDKALVDPDALKSLGQTRSSARIFLQKLSLPFPLDGVMFVPLDAVEIADAGLVARAAVLAKQASDLQYIMPALKGEARRNLGPLYNDSDYPANIQERFALRWTWLNVSAPDGSMQEFAPEAFKQAQFKFEQTMNAARDMAITALRVEFKEMLDAIVERLSDSGDGKKKIFRDSLVGNFTEFFETFKSRNVWDDSALADLVEKAKKVVGNVDPATLRDSAWVRGQIRDSMAVVKVAMESALVDAGPRAISFEGE
jgi:hypothetical protein